MEALAVFGVASNVVQFIDFASRLVTAANTLYDSARGVTKENEQVELLARNLRQLAQSEDIRELAEKTQPDDSQHADQGTSNPGSLVSLSQLCIEAADEILNLLDKLKVKGKHRGSESVYRALQTVWKKDDIERLEKRLKRISDVLNNEIRRKQQDLFFNQIRLLQQDNSRLQATRDSEIMELKGFVKKTFQEISESFEEIKGGLHREEDYSTLNRTHQAWLQLPYAVERRQELQFENYFLQELRYITMDNRHFSIPTEHAQTFQWIFNTESSLDSGSPVNFVQWLRSDGDLFWITGKPGCGKSTLMKFIATHEDVSRHLKDSKWLGSSKLVMASYFFWSAAKDPLQKSQAGLLRSILYQIFLQYPDLILDAFPTCRPSFEKGLPLAAIFREVPCLLGALKNVSEAVPNYNIKFCFIIDGLDEYDGKPASVIEFIEVLRHFPNVKICVSSRPWNEFQARFGIGEWQLAVHELTKSDIRTYVVDTLGADSIFTNLRHGDQRYPDLVNTIIDSADGVFLWVFLVVRSLLEGLTNADRIIDLQKRLEEIPTDLEAFFQRILTTVDDRYQQNMAVTFIISLEAFRNLPVLVYWFFDEYEENPEYVFQPDTVRKLSEIKIETRLQQSLKRTNARCKGLLETRAVSDNTKSWAVRSFTWQVDFLHRTVKEFLALPSMQERLIRWSAGRSAVDYGICCGIIAMVKSVPSLVMSEHAPQLMQTFFHHATCLQNCDLVSDLAKRLPSELQQSLRRRGIFDYDLWTTNLNEYKAEALQRGYEILDISEIDAGFIFACGSAGLVSYISQVLHSHPRLITSIGSGLLSQLLATTRGPDGQHDFEWESKKVDLCIFLLQSGVDPNNVASSFQNLYMRTTSSSWELYLTKLKYLETLPSLKNSLHSSRAFLCCMALLKHSANPCAEVRSQMQTLDKAVHNQPAYSFLRDIFTENEYSTLRKAFHFQNDVDAAAVRKFLEEASVKNEVDSGLSPTPVDSADRESGKLSPLPDHTRSTKALSRKKFVANLKKIRGRLGA